MQDRLIGEPIRLEPLTGFVLQYWNLIWQCLLQTPLQQISEEMVVSIPLPFVIQGNNKQVGLIKIFQCLKALCLAG